MQEQTMYINSLELLAATLAVKTFLKDAYLTVPMHPDHQCYLQFSVGGIDYQFTCLPFRLACAPWAFTKIMKAVVALRGVTSHPSMSGVHHQHREVSDDSR